MMKKHMNIMKVWVLLITLMLAVNSPSLGTMNSKAATKMGVTYAVHVQTYGDSQGWVSNGAMAGTHGEAKRLEEIRIKLTGDAYSGNIRYKTHVQSFGWRDWSADGAANGSRGQGKRLEAIEIELTGEVAQYYDVTYRVHCQSYGWMPWVKNGEMAGTSGQAKRLEGIEIKLVPKTKVAKMGVQYRTHCQTYGWLNWSVNGASNGTTGQGKRLEAIEIKLTGNEYSGGIEYRTHVQTYGWEKNFVSNGALSGTSGQAKRLEAIQIQLYGEVANYYDVYYRVHAQTYGWLGWVKNGSMAGTSGLAKRLESIEIRVVPKYTDVSEFDGSGNGQITKEPDKTPSGIKYSSNDDYMYKVIELINNERRKVGVHELVFDKGLTLAANVRAKENYDHVSYTTRPDGSPFYTAYPSYIPEPYKELSCGGHLNPERLVNNLLEENGSGNRKILLSEKYGLIGVGYNETPDRWERYWIIELGGLK